MTPRFSQSVGGSLADNNASFSEKILDIRVAKLETALEPNGVSDYVRWESIAFVNIRQPVLPMTVC